MTRRWSWILPRILNPAALSSSEGGIPSRKCPLCSWRTRCVSTHRRWGQAWTASPGSGGCSSHTSSWFIHQAIYTPSLHTPHWYRQWLAWMSRPPYTTCICTLSSKSSWLGLLPFYRRQARPPDLDSRLRTRQPSQTIWWNLAKTGRGWSWSSLFSCFGAGRWGCSWIS